MTVTIQNAPATAHVEQVEARGTWYAWYVTFILTACYTLSFVDSKIPFILVQLIKKDLSLTDTQMGILAGPAFSLTYALCTIPLARLSDRFTRKYIIAGAVTIWSAFTASCGFAHSFGLFMLGRVGVAFGEAALTPAAHSIIADYFPERQRAKVIAIYFSGIAIGGFLALSLGGFLADRYGWRSAMFVVGAAGVTLSLLMVATVREPVREKKNPARRLSEGSLMALFVHPAIRNTIIGGTLLGMSFSAVGAWSPAYIMRTYGMSASATGASLGALSGIIALVGTLAGGFVASWFARKDPRYGHRFLAIGFAISAPLNVLSFFMTSYPFFLALHAAATLLVITYPGPTYATVQSLVQSGARSFASAVTLFCIQGLGIAFGAFFAGFLSDRLVGLFGQDSLRWSMAAMSLLSIWSAVHYWKASSHLKVPDAA